MIYNARNSSYHVNKKQLKEIVSISTGNRPSKDIEYGQYPYVNGGTSPSDYFSDYNSEPDAITTPTHGEGGIGFVAFQKSRFWCGALCLRMYALSDDVNIKFIFYYLSNSKEEILSKKNYGGMPYINKIEFSRIQIPLPHIKVQEEIVKILDSFTNLIDALNEELSLREKQFEYYREKLLTFDDKSVYTTLGKVGEFTRGNGLQKKDFTEYGFPCIHYGQIHTSYNTSASSTISYCSKSLAKKLKKAKYGDLLIATTSEDVDACCKAIAWLGEGEVAYSGDSYCFSHNENPKYMAYLFQCNMFYNQKKKSAIGAKVIRVSGDSMSQFVLPIPSLSIQQSIVEKLDAFESLISSLKEEIALRQKQYEYYREKLLTFE